MCVCIWRCIDCSGSQSKDVDAEEGEMTAYRTSVYPVSPTGPMNIWSCDKHIKNNVNSHVIIKFAKRTRFSSHKVFITCHEMLWLFILSLSKNQLRPSLCELDWSGDSVFCALPLEHMSLPLKPLSHENLNGWWVFRSGPDKADGSLSAGKL